MNLLYHKCSVKSNNRHGEAGVFWCLFLVFIWCLFRQKQTPKYHILPTVKIDKPRYNGLFQVLQSSTKRDFSGSSPVTRTSPSVHMDTRIFYFVKCRYKVNRGRNLEFKNDTIQISASFSML